MAAAIKEPEVYYLQPTACAPNSPLPYLVYRNVLPQPLTEASTAEFLEASGCWKKTGPAEGWSGTTRRHYHPNVHECYGYFRGSATTLLGVATGDTDIEAPESTPGSTTKGLKLRVNAGDVVVQPAGTAHSQPETDGDLRFVALFPWGEKYKSLNGAEPIDLPAMRAETMAAGIPHDPVCGEDGYLQGLWRAAEERYRADGKEL